MTPNNPIHALTFDVEEYFHVHAFRREIQSQRWDDYSPRIEMGMRPILELLDECGVRATFFVLGWVARRHPDVVREISAAGHELASHGYNHRRVDEQTPREFRADIRAAKLLLEQIAGQPVTAYRAPSFSITANSPWAYEVLVEEGHTLDSSASPGRGQRSIDPLSRGLPYSIATRQGPLIEFPLPGTSLAGLTVPVGGGGYFRLFPESITRRAIRNAETQTKPFCIYLHPWEFDAEQPRMTASWTTNFRHRVGLEKTSDRLRNILKSFRFGTMAQSLLSVWPNAVSKPDAMKSLCA